MKTKIFGSSPVQLLTMSMSFMLVCVLATSSLAREQTQTKVYLRTAEEKRIWEEKNPRPTSYRAIESFGDDNSLLIPLDGSFTLALDHNDDGSMGPIALPFTFDMFGDPYNEVWINNNGNITFTSGSGSYTPTGFPLVGPPMIAPFWADVDTRNLSSGLVYYKVESTRLTVIWEHVGYYPEQVDKVNTFEVIISDGTDVIVPACNNICFSYGDMQWTTGSASGGTAGFGGTPAEVGVNRGD